MTLLTEEIRALLGARKVYTAPEELGAAAGRYFALAIGDDNPIYSDGEFARAQGLPGVTAPLTLICETNQYAGLPIDSDGYAGHSWNISIPDTRRVRGGNTYRFERRIRPDDVITATWEIADISEKTTRSGADMLVITSRATLHQPGRRAARRQRGAGHLREPEGRRHDLGGHGPGSLRAADHARRHGGLRRSDLGLLRPALRPGVRSAREGAGPRRGRPGLRRAVRRAAAGRARPAVLRARAVDELPQPDVRRRDRPRRRHCRRGRRGALRRRADRDHPRLASRRRARPAASGRATVLLGTPDGPGAR